MRCEIGINDGAKQAAAVTESERAASLDFVSFVCASLLVLVVGNLIEHHISSTPKTHRKPGAVDG
jgi:hypothetical protein